MVPAGSHGGARGGAFPVMILTDVKQSVPEVGIAPGRMFRATVSNHVQRILDESSRRGILVGFVRRDREGVQE